MASDGRSIVDTRRWEASRDGVEDYNALRLLREKLEQRPDPTIESLLSEATTYVETTAFTGLPREAADYDLDFSKFMKYRERIRDALEQLGK